MRNQKQMASRDGNKPRKCNLLIKLIIALAHLWMTPAELISVLKKERKEKTKQL